MHGQISIVHMYTVTLLEKLMNQNEQLWSDLWCYLPYEMISLDMLQSIFKVSDVSFISFVSVA